MTKCEEYAVRISECKTLLDLENVAKLIRADTVSESDKEYLRMFWKSRRDHYINVKEFDPKTAFNAQGLKAWKNEQ
jgi:hypothetical protein